MAAVSEVSIVQYFTASVGEPISEALLANGLPQKK